MSECKHGELNATTGRTLPPPLTDGHEMPHVEDRIAQGYMTEWARCVAMCAAALHAGSTSYSKAEALDVAADFVTRAQERDRHERLRYPKPAPEP